MRARNPQITRTLTRAMDANSLAQKFEFGRHDHKIDRQPRLCSLHLRRRTRHHTHLLPRVRSFSTRTAAAWMAKPVRLGFGGLDRVEMSRSILSNEQGDVQCVRRSTAIFISDVSASSADVLRHAFGVRHEPQPIRY